MRSSINASSRRSTPVPPTWWATSSVSQMTSVLGSASSVFRTPSARPKSVEACHSRCAAANALVTPGGVRRPASKRRVRKGPAARAREHPRLLEYPGPRCGDALQSVLRPAPSASRSRRSTAVQRAPLTPPAGRSEEGERCEPRRRPRRRAGRAAARDPRNATRRAGISGLCGPGCTPVQPKRQRSCRRGAPRRRLRTRRGLLRAATRAHRSPPARTVRIRCRARRTVAARRSGSSPVHRTATPGLAGANTSVSVKCGDSGPLTRSSTATTLVDPHSVAGPRRVHDDVDRVAHERVQRREREVRPRFGELAEEPQIG